MAEDIEYPEHNHVVTIPQLRCEHCLYFEDFAIYKEKCKTLGVQPKSRPCTKFVANARQLDVNQTEVQNLFETINNMSRPQVALLTAVLAREHITRTNGHKFFDIVYVRKFGDDYISNYVKARIISIDSGMAYLRGVKKEKFFASVKKESVLTPEQWQKKKTQLVSLNRWRDPNLLKFTNFKMPVKSKASIAAYEPPNIDTWGNAVSLFDAKPIKGNKKSKVITLR